MGRLTLNVLLSFAQFERQVTGERIRDKIAASKRKGMWMGGTVPLGYDVKNRKLVVNATEAERVREIFRQYLKLGCVSLKEWEDGTHGWGSPDTAGTIQRRRDVMEGLGWRQKGVYSSAREGQIGNSGSYGFVE